MASRTQRSNAIRALSIDAIEKANSGHPGAPMGLADVAEVLWRDVLNHNPRNPQWVNRDRFVMSNGHGSMLLYAVLHLTGYDVSIADIQNFRQLHSKTAGHPEYGICPGVETTTGPLGQGLANGVGMALAEKLLANEFNRREFAIVDHKTWVFVGDGCLMEGISHEAASLAATLELGKLNCVYDSNGISIDGETKHWFTEDVALRFESYGWHVVRDVDGHDPDGVSRALEEAEGVSDKPSLICCNTIIGFGAPTKQGTASVHGAALGEDEVAATRRQLNWDYGPFEVPQEIYDDWDMSAVGEALERNWQVLFDGYKGAYPELAAEYERRMAGELPVGWERALMAYAASAQNDLASIETRKASQACLDVLGPMIPELLGGSADLTGSNGTQWNGAGWLHEGGRYLNFGVREFGMTAITNGVALHGGLIPYSGTFLIFMEYARNALRLASLMGIRNVLVYTHDSVALGEDGPTHQPIEQLTNLRTTPNLSLWRPCDAVETAYAWAAALQRRSGPTALALTRQKTICQVRDDIALVGRGGYVLCGESGELDAIVIASGSEVELAVEASETLRLEGLHVRVVSMPSVDVFLAQDEAYREAVLPSNFRRRVAVEAGHPDYWYRFVGLDGRVVGIDRFGLSAPGEVAMNELGINVAAVIAAIHEVAQS
jgi:transketolase